MHYFAPKDLPPLPKNVVFVLDSSASMVGTKLRQVSECQMPIFPSVAFARDSVVDKIQLMPDVCFPAQLLLPIEDIPGPIQLTH